MIRPTTHNDQVNNTMIGSTTHNDQVNNTTIRLTTHNLLEDCDTGGPVMAPPTFRLFNILFPSEVLPPLVVVVAESV